ncbi:MAG: RNA polymerase sigma factor SigX [Thermincolia bacterium]
MLQTHDFKELYDTYYPAVCRQLSHLLREGAAAEDVAQEAFLKLYDTPPARLDNPGGWLKRVANNLALNFLRGEKNRQIRETRVHLQEDLVSASTEEVFLRSQEAREVREVMDRLPVRDKTCLLLRFSGFSYDEIAEVIGVQKSSVGTILARAQARFKEEFQHRKGSGD